MVPTSYTSEDVIVVTMKKAGRKPVPEKTRPLFNQIKKI